MQKSMSGLSREEFSGVVQGKSVDLFQLTNSNGMEVCVTNYGGFIPSVMVPDMNGNYVDVVLGHQTLEQYKNAPEKYLGSVVGRYGNRIAKGKFVLEGVKYSLAVNNGPNHLHGGAEGFNLRVWDVLEVTTQYIKLGYFSPDGEEGFPGDLSVIMEYSLTDDNALVITYQAWTNATTIVNLTNHAFFNLSGQGDATVCDHELMINADYFIPIDKTSIPTGEILKVKGTPFDFTRSTTIGARINEKDKQLEHGSGYDHSFVVRRKCPKEIVKCAWARSPKTGIVLETYTSEPAVQLYTGNWLGGFEGKHGARYPERSAFCLETQLFPDSPNKVHFPSCVLSPGEKYEHVCIYQFSVAPEN